MNKTALVTGAGSGIGKALSITLAQRGYHILLVGRDHNRLELASHEISAFSTSRIFCTNLTDPVARARLTDSVLAQTGTPALLVNNAAVMPYGAFLNATDAQLQETFATNLAAPADLTLRLFRSSIHQQMSKQHGVIFVLSAAARFPQPYNSLYSASKAGLRYLAESLQVEMDSHIQICLAYPPLTASPMTENFIPPNRLIQKSSTKLVAEKIIAGYEAGKFEVAWFDWEAIPSWFYRFAPKVFRRVLKSQKQKLQQLFK
jgi:uncharacterized protein